MEVVGAILGAAIGLVIALPWYLQSRMMDRLETHMARLQREIDGP